MNTPEPTHICVHGNTLYAAVCAAVFSEHYTVTLSTNETTSIESLEVDLAEKIQTYMQHKVLTSQPTFTAIQYANFGIHFFSANENIESIENVISDVYPHLKHDLYFVIQTPYVLDSLDHLEKYSIDISRKNTSKYRIHIIGMPLFIREGSAIQDFSNPWLILASGSAENTAWLIHLLKPYIQPQTKVMQVSHRTAELIRLSINAMLATRISFVNEMSTIAEHLDVDIQDITTAMGADPRIGANYLQPGCGFGGTKFSDDLTRYANISDRQLGHKGLINTVLSINESQREILFRKLWRFFNGKLNDKHIAILGCAYKPNSKSIENSAILTLLPALWAQGCTVRVYDPEANQALAEAYPHQPNLTICSNLESAINNMDAVLIVTSWDEFKAIDLTWLKSKLKHPVIFDGRNIYDPQKVANAGLNYFAIGRGLTI